VHVARVGAARPGQGAEDLGGVFFDSTGEDEFDRADFF
jgi:hypothetical protein